MGAHTHIEWTDATWNPIGGCSIKSPGCIGCYAQELAGTRLKTHPLYAGTTDLVKGKPVFNGHLTAAADGHGVWSWPVRWRGSKTPKLGPGQPSTIFVGDMSDLFHAARARDIIDRVVASIIYSPHIGQLLTKRPDVMADYFDDLRRSGRWLAFHHPLFGKSNFDPYCASFDRIRARLWLGSSVERQPEADERRKHMQRLAQMGFTTFVSYEPALGPVDWTGWEFLAQIISGGESGRDDPRPSHPDWHRAARDFCIANDIAFFFKQWGAWSSTKPAGFGRISKKRYSHQTRTFRPDGQSYRATEPDSLLDDCMVTMYRVAGKKAAGRLLDGREWSEMPGARHSPSRVPTQQPELVP